MEEVAERQARHEDHPVVAVLRDPVARFVSAASQLINMRILRVGACGRHMSRKVPADCAACAVETLLGGRYDPHFEPSLSDLLCNVNFTHKVAVSVYDTTALSSILQSLGEEEGHVTVANNSSKKQIVLTLNDFDADMIKAICFWFAADIMMRRELGLPVEHCDFINSTSINLS
jgi:hypothetical protein